MRSPRCTRKQSNGPGTAPTAFWTKRSRSYHVVVAGDHRAADDVGVAAEVLGRRVHDEVGAELERALVGRRGERVVDRDERAAAPRATTPSMSITFSSGLVGLSTQISRVSSRTAALERVEVGLVDEVVRRPQRLSTLSTRR